MRSARFRPRMSVDASGAGMPAAVAELVRTPTDWCHSQIPSVRWRRSPWTRHLLESLAFLRLQLRQAAKPTVLRSATKCPNEGIPKLDLRRRTQLVAFRVDALQERSAQLSARVRLRQDPARRRARRRGCITTRPDSSSAALAVPPAAAVRPRSHFASARAPGFASGTCRFLMRKA